MHWLLAIQKGRLFGSVPFNDFRTPLPYFCPLKKCITYALYILPSSIQRVPEEFFNFFLLIKVKKNFVRKVCRVEPF